MNWRGRRSPGTFVPRKLWRSAPGMAAETMRREERLDTAALVSNDGRFHEFAVQIVLDPTRQQTGSCRSYETPRNP